ncbi:N-acetyl-D-Glu racemase DgcA [Henriciella sp.]|uniref:N-acetyl-D-Glu racemase DgcA n=1 Tax=Henriciella sp. TaxID=1968823 RepID=UPI00262A41D9|nr:N-acetyl-D-Glu racemase DgcA [Henriciella sp.]
MTTLHIEHVSAPLRKEFSISRGAKSSAETVRVTLEADGYKGRGECVPYNRYDETVGSVTEKVESMRSLLEKGLDRTALQEELPAGAARCAIDCAMWDLEAKRSGAPVWQLAGLPEPAAMPTAATIVLASPEDMALEARDTAGSILKLKLGGQDDMARVEAVHEARPDAKLILDANEGIDGGTFPDIVRRAAQLGVVLIEQPFPAGDDAFLMRRPPEVAICADESMHVREDVQELVRLYDVVNIKLDKTGGLTEALAAAREAKAAGLGIMIGCMVAGSLSMAPAVLLGALADVVDLDGPLWLSEDIADGLTYKNGLVHPPSTALWG